MTAVLVTTAQPNTAEWHEARTQGIGASEISAVVGLNPRESAYSLWLRKKGLIPGPNPENPLFDWGHRLEPVVAAKFAELHPEYDVQDIDIHAHNERPWQIASLDRLAVTAGRAIPLEIKTSRFGDDYGTSGTDEVPLYVRCQVMQQMDVFGARSAWVAALIGGSDYREYRIEYDDADATALREAGAAFWESLQTDDEPPLDASFATYEAVRARHPEIDSEDVELDPEVFAEYRVSKDNYDHADQKHRAAKSAVLAALGTAKRGLYFGTPVLRRQPGRGGSVSLYPITQKETA